MAAAIVGGAFLSGFINAVFDRLSSPEVANLIQGKKLDQDLLQKLETTLNVVQAVLNDADHKQIKDPAVKNWVNTLTDAVYVADDTMFLLKLQLKRRHEENGIKELGELSNLHGSFWSRKLEYVTNSGEALEARIMDKKHINTLSFEWSSSGDMVTSSETERDIFDKLQPHKGLIELNISCYTGTRFPELVGHSSYHSMTHVSLESCSNCCMLPSLGQLPSF